MQVQQTLELSVEVVATDGEVICLPINASGVATGFGRIGNPYWDGDEHWRLKDGETVIGCEEFHPESLPVADAYQKLRRQYEDEQAEWDEENKAHNAVSIAQSQDEEWDAKYAWLFNIQDQLSQ